MKNIILLLFFTNSYAQLNSGTVYYQKIVMTFYNKDGETIDPLSQNIKKYGDLHSYLLTFSKFQSKCVFIENLVADNDESKNFSYYASVVCDDYDYYFDKLQKRGIISFNTGHIVENNSSLNWNLTNEQKTIQNYKCFKATSVKKIKNHKGQEKNIDLIAWYCPELPFSYGPKEFNSLPGIILEFQDNFNILVATKIVLSDKEIKINFPNKEPITYEEYRKLMLQEK